MPPRKYTSKDKCPGIRRRGGQNGVQKRCNRVPTCGGFCHACYNRVKYGAGRADKSYLPWESVREKKRLKAEAALDEAEND